MPEVVIKVGIGLLLYTVTGNELTVVQDGDLESYVIALNSTVKEHIHDGAHRLRKLLSVGMSNPDANNDHYTFHYFAFITNITPEKNPPIESVINAGAVPRFVQLLAYPDQQIQFEVCCFTLRITMFCFYFMFSTFIFTHSVVRLGPHKHCKWYIRANQTRCSKWCYSPLHEPASI